MGASFFVLQDVELAPMGRSYKYMLLRQQQPTTDLAV